MINYLGLKRVFILLSFHLFVLGNANASTILIEAESFADKGGWVVDQQFMDQMGSPYLMAHGLGKAVDDAKTEVSIPENGVYHVYTRTFNWTSPWSQKKGAGQFNIKIGNKTLKTNLGSTGDKWEWQYAGKISLKKGDTELKLHDLTGFNGRCDAIILTTDKSLPLPDSGEELKNLRSKLTPPVYLDPQNFDIIVAGAGTAGMCAAMSAARLGSKVALINDRPVLGGNNSAEVRVHLGGRIELGPNKGLGRMVREFGHTRKGNAKPAEYYEDDKKLEFIKSNSNITLFPSYHVNKAKTEGNRISSIQASNIENGNIITLTAPIFIDCTGDGTLGYLAGADYREGREASSEFGESLAPDSPDNMTMGASVQWYSEEKNNPQPFPHFDFDLPFNDDNCERVTHGEWTWEAGIGKDQIKDAEWIRDYGLMVLFSNWDYIKNHLKLKEFGNQSLEWAAYIGGRRESRRLMGDYILKQDDIDKNVFHEDASFTTSWSIDLHFQDPKNALNFNGEPYKAETKHYRIYPYAVPYRCLYSRNISNLLMAGRNISCTHVGLGTVRVMRTTAMMGEVAGIAANICNKNNCSPREVYSKHLPTLKNLMQKGIGKNADNLPDNQRFNNQKNLKKPYYSPNNE